MPDNGAGLHVRSRDAYRANVRLDGKSPSDSRQLVRVLPYCVCTAIIAKKPRMVGTEDSPIQIDDSRFAFRVSLVAENTTAVVF